MFVYADVFRIYFQKDYLVPHTKTREFVSALEKVSGVAHVVHTMQEASVTLCSILDLLSPKVIAVAPLPQDILERLQQYASEKSCTLLGPAYAARDLPMGLDPADVGISFAEFGIAESGTVVEVTENDAHRLVSAMPRTHIALVYAKDLVPDLRNAAPRMRDIFQSHADSVAVSFISGPSRTGDIEMILTLGVHGPEAAHVIVIEEAESP